MKIYYKIFFFICNCGIAYIPKDDRAETEPSKIKIIKNFEGKNKRK